eukprot:4250970-Prymnesium_polylepis.1
MHAPRHAPPATHPDVADVCVSHFQQHRCHASTPIQQPRLFRSAGHTCGAPPTLFQMAMRSPKGLARHCAKSWSKSFAAPATCASLEPAAAASPDAISST